MIHTEKRNWTEIIFALWLETCVNISLILAVLEEHKSAIFKINKKNGTLNKQILNVKLSK